MGGALLTVVKEVDGEYFSNSYAIGVGDFEADLTEADLTAMIDVGTVGADQTPAVSPKVVNAIVDFEMEIMPAFVNFHSILVGDGRNTEEGPDAVSLFYSKRLSIHGNRYPLGSQSDICPGNIALLVSKVAGGFSTRPGACQYRLVLPKTWVLAQGLGLVDWADDATKVAAQDFIDDALAASGLSTHFAGGANVAGGVVGIAHYQPESDPPAFSDGNLIGLTPIVGLNVIKPMSRQVKRGRKEK
jgi:hypothetical protein